MRHGLQDFIADLEVPAEHLQNESPRPDRPAGVPRGPGAPRPRPASARSGDENSSASGLQSSFGSSGGVQLKPPRPATRRRECTQNSSASSSIRRPIRFHDVKRVAGQQRSEVGEIAEIHGGLSGRVFDGSRASVNRRQTRCRPPDRITLITLISCPCMPPRGLPARRGQRNVSERQRAACCQDQTFLKSACEMGVQASSL